MPMGCPERRPLITVIGFDVTKSLFLTTLLVRISYFVTSLPPSSRHAALRAWHSNSSMRILSWRMMMKRTSLTDLREEMRAVARGERNPSPRPAAPLLAALSMEALELLSVLLRERPETI